MDGIARKPLTVSPDVFCTPAVQRHQDRERSEEWASHGKNKLTLERLTQERERTPTEGSILAVRDQNVEAARPASVKRVSFKDVAVTSPAGGVHAPTESRLGGILRAPVQRQGQRASQQPAVPAPSPGPWSQLVEGIKPEQSFTSYLNPLADDEPEAESLEQYADAQRHTPTSQLSRAVDTATSRGVAFHMQTPEAVQVLHKIALHGKGIGRNASSLDAYLRTGPRELSPEPGMVLTTSLREQESGGVEVRASVESSEDENMVDDGTAKAHRQIGGDRVVVASPIRAKAAPETSDLDEVPPTFQLGGHGKTAGRATSPVKFNLLGDSPESFGEVNDADGADDASSKDGKEKSFSFGMGQARIGAANDSEVTAQFLEEYCDVDGGHSQSQGESVDQPNPFADMLVRLREDPVRLQSPVVGTIIKASASDGSIAGSPESPANCTPMNLICTSSAASLPGSGTGASDVERESHHVMDVSGPSHDVYDIDASSLDEWMLQHGLKNLSTPTRSDLRKMWSALDGIRNATGAYERVLQENTQLREALWEAEEAETDALELVRIEQDRSRDAANKMSELAISMHHQFALLEDERRKLQRDLDEARHLLDTSVEEGAANVMQELEHLKAELERLRVAEQEARLDAQNARNAATRAIEEQLALGDAEKDEEVSLGHAEEGANNRPNDHQAELEADRNLTGFQAKVEFFEGLRMDATCGIKHPASAEDDGVADNVVNVEEHFVVDGVPEDEQFVEVDDAHACKEQAVEDILAGLSAMSPFLECPGTGTRAPQTTPVDGNMNTPHRIHIESMNSFRETWQTTPLPESSAVKPEFSKVSDAVNELEDTEIVDDAASDTSETSSDYEMEEIIVSPIDVEDLTRANLRQTVIQRIAAVKSDLANAKSKLSHAQAGFKGRGAPVVQTINAPPVPTVVEAAEDCDATNTLTPDAAPALDAVEPQPSSSHRSVFARLLDSTSTPLSVRRAVFTPKTSMSVLKSTARMSPRFSSASSSATPLPPNYLVQNSGISRPHQRMRRFAREPSAEEDREFLRRAAALNIHVSPYMKRGGRRSMALN